MATTPKQVKDNSQAITALQWRLLGSYALFQVFNLINLLVAIVLSACLLAFVLALRGQTVSHLLPWFLLMAVPIWIGGSYWTYSLLIRYGVLRSKSNKVKKSKAAPKPVKSAKQVQPPEPANDDDQGLLSKVTPLRRLFSL